MGETRSAGMLEHFSAIVDPRVERTRAYALLDIIVVAVCAGQTIG